MNRYLELVYRLIIVALTIIPFTSQILLAQNESTEISYEDAYRVLLEVDANPKYKGLIFYYSYEHVPYTFSFSSDGGSPKQSEMPMKDYMKGHISGCSSVKEVREKIEDAYEFVYNMNHHDTGPFSVVEFKEEIEMPKDGYNGRSDYWYQPDSIFIRTRLFNKETFFANNFLATKNKIETFVDSVSNMIESSRHLLQCNLDSTAMANYKDEGLSYRDFLIKKCDEDDELQYKASSEWRLRFTALTFVKELSDLQKKQIFCGQYNNMITNLKKERAENYNKLQAFVKDFKTLGYSHIKDTPVFEIWGREYEIPDGKVYVRDSIGLSVDSLYQIYRKESYYYNKKSKSKDVFRKIASNKRLAKFFKKKYDFKPIELLGSFFCYGGESEVAKYILNNPSVLESVGKMDISERGYCIKYLEEYSASGDSVAQLNDFLVDLVDESLKKIKNTEDLSRYLKNNWGLDVDGQVNTESLIDAFYKTGVEHLKYKGYFDGNVIYYGENEMIVADANSRKVTHYFRLKDGRWARQQEGGSRFYNENAPEYTNLDMYKAEMIFYDEQFKYEPKYEFGSYSVIDSDEFPCTKVYSRFITYEMLPCLGDEYTTINGRRLVSIANRMQLPIDECGWYYKKGSLVKRDLKAEDQMETFQRLIIGTYYTNDREHSISGKPGSVIYKDPEIVELKANTDTNELVLAVGMDYTNADGTKKYIDTMPSEDYIKFVNTLKPKLEAEFLRRCNASDKSYRMSELRNYTAKYGAAQARAFLNNNKQPFKGMTLRFFRNEFGDACSVLREDNNGNATFKYDGGFFMDHYYYFRHGVLTHWTYSR